MEKAIIMAPKTIIGALKNKRKNDLNQFGFEMYQQSNE